MMRYFTVMVVTTVVVWLATGTVLTLAGHGDAVPVLGPDRRQAARRFVTLIDALYEAGTRLVVRAAAEPEALYPKGDGAFEFERIVSRLREMSSASWLEKAEHPCD